MPTHRPRHFALIACRAGRQPAVSLGHALGKHEIGRYSPLGSGVIAANLLDRSRVVVGLAQLLRQRHAAPTQENDRCESGYRASAPAASDHRHFTNFCSSRAPDCRVKVPERFIFWLAEHSAPLLVVRGFGEISEHFHAQVRSHPASLILIAQGPGSTAVSPEVDPGRRGTTSRAVKVST